MNQLEWQLEQIPVHPSAADIGCKVGHCLAQNFENGCRAHQLELIQQQIENHLFAVADICIALAKEFHPCIREHLFAVQNKRTAAGQEIGEAVLTHHRIDFALEKIVDCACFNVREFHLKPADCVNNLNE